MEYSKLGLSLRRKAGVAVQISPSPGARPFGCLAEGLYDASRDPLRVMESYITAEGSFADKTLRTEQATMGRLH